MSTDTDKLFVLFLSNMICGALWFPGGNLGAGRY